MAEQEHEIRTRVREAYMHAGLYAYAIGEFALIKVFIDYKVFDAIPDKGDITISGVALKLTMAEVLASPTPGRVAHMHKSLKYRSDTLEAGLIYHVFNMLFRPLAKLPSFFKTHGLASPKDSKITPFGQAFNHPEWDVYRILDSKPALHNQFNQVLKGLGTMYSLKGVYDFSWMEPQLTGSRAALVDIGGSSGLVIKDTLANNSFIAPASLKDIQFVSGSIFEPLPENLKGACLYQMRRILNDFTDEDVLKALKTVRAAAAPDSILVIEEMLSPVRNILNAGMDVFLMLVGGKKRDSAMFSDLAVRAGLRLNGEYKQTSAEFDDFSVLAFVAV
ncbi:hypothetical protein N7537_008971 [Penicillium hordei]|uniref:O-methyltransferase C-terminal domain-containing protein n=1 Tax=Penicillium hordei TaxID=40994 RepID=A0AAD6GW57_9EURO|nr:uncharacterized protein N7537_008971 [Penicillium hordei]KAJ5592067.1 hypothetical protein N7537_008971 [Penicillium hordei]